MHNIAIWLSLVLLILLAGASGQEATPTPLRKSHSHPYKNTDPASLTYVADQRIYVPADALIPTSV